VQGEGLQSFERGMMPYCHIKNGVCGGGVALGARALRVSGQGEGLQSCGRGVIGCVVMVLALERAGGQGEALW